MSDLGIRLVKGSQSFDLNLANKYISLRNFVPPATTETPVIAAGTIQNDIGLGTVISKKASQREWSFSVRLIGNSAAEIQERIRALQLFLSMAGNPNDPLYVEVRTTTDAPGPMWGQGAAPLRYEVLHGTMELSEDYALAARRKHAVSALLTLTIQPYALGKRQRLASVTGGILEDSIGSIDGSSLGLIIPEATTNKIYNPLFHWLPWGTNWTTGASLISSKNTDRRYTLYGLVSAKLTRIASVDVSFTQSVNVGNTNTHTLSCYAKRDDGAPVTSADAILYYGSQKTTTYTPVRDGWYRLTTTMAGINAATATGLTVSSVGRSIYVTGWQMEEKGWATPLAYGDLLGNTWSGTQPNATSVRAAGVAKVAIEDIFNVGSGTFRVVVKMPHDSTWTTYATHILARDVTPFEIYYNKDINKFILNDGTNSISGNVQTFSAGAIFVLHATWGADGIALYVNGVPNGSNATYTPSGNGAYFYLGSLAAATEQTNLCLMGLSSLDYALTSAQVLADYNNIAPLVADDKRIESIPYFWTLAGDNVTSQYTDATHHHWGVAGGISGTQQAETEFHILLDNSASGNFDADGKAFYLSLLDVIEAGHLPTSLETYRDEQVTTTDANDIGGKATSYTITTSEYTLPAIYFDSDKLLAVAGRQVWCLIRMRDAGSNLRMAQANLVGDSRALGTYRSLTADGTSRIFLLNPIMILDSKDVFALPAEVALLRWTQFGIALNAIRTTGSASITIDYFFVVCDPLLQVKATLATAAFPAVGARVNGMRAAIFYNGTDQMDHLAQATGRAIEFQPNRYNIIFAWRGAHGNAHVITRTMTFSKVYYTPRWSLT